MSRTMVRANQFLFSLLSITVTIVVSNSYFSVGYIYTNYVIKNYCFYLSDLLKNVDPPNVTPILITPCYWQPLIICKMDIPFGIYLLTVNRRNTGTSCEICSKLTIKTPERRQLPPCSSVSIFNFEHVIASWDIFYIDFLLIETMKL